MACGSTRHWALPRTHANRRRTGIVLGIAACVALIGVPVGLLATSGPEPATQSAQQHHVTVSDGVAKRSVLAALSATTDSGSFAFSYQLSETPYQSSTEVEGPGCSGLVVSAVHPSPKHPSAGVGHDRHESDGDGGVGRHQFERSQRASSWGSSRPHDGVGSVEHR